MSKFTSKVEAFLADVEKDAEGAEAAVVAWFHRVFSSHKAGTPIPLPAQAGSLVTESQLYDADAHAQSHLVDTAKANRVEITPPSVTDVTSPPIQAGTGRVATPSPPADAGMGPNHGLVGAQPAAAPITGMKGLSADGTKITPPKPEFVDDLSNEERAAIEDNTRKSGAQIKPGDVAVDGTEPGKLVEKSAAVQDNIKPGDVAVDGTEPLPKDFPKDRLSWNEAKWQEEIAAAKSANDAYVAKAKANGTYGGPGVVGDTHYVWAGLVANHKMLQERGLIPSS